MKKTRAPDLTQETLQSVLDILDGWKGKLTWNLLLDEIEKASGIKYSRFTFAEYPQIANAFSLKKRTLRGTWKPGASEPRDEKVRAALAQVDRYKAKVARLEQENKLLLEQFVTWAYNAERKNVTIAALNQPIPKPQRDRSKGVE